MIEGARCAHEPCGRPFTKARSGQKYCSQQCSRAAQEARRTRQPRTVNCDHCGKPFETNSYRKRFCDRACAAASQRETRREQARRKKATLCSTCAGDLPRNPIWHLRAAFCSWRCYFNRTTFKDPNSSADDQAHLTVLDLQQSAAHVRPLPPITSPLDAWAIDEDGMPRLSDARVAAPMHDPDEAPDDGISMAAPEPSPDEPEIDEWLDKPIKHTRTDWGISDGR